MKKNYIEMIKKELNKQNIVTASFCKENNIPLVYLQRMVDKKQLYKLACGIYTNDEAFTDDIWLKQQVNKKIIFSGLTALSMLGETDWVGTTSYCDGPEGYKVSPNSNITLTTDSKYYGLGEVKIKSPEGRDMRCYSYERILCDLIRKRQADYDWAYDAFENYNYYDNKNLKELKSLAKKMNVDLIEFSKRGLNLNE